MNTHTGGDFDDFLRVVDLGVVAVAQRPSERAVQEDADLLMVHDNTLTQTVEA
ncbi:MAG TPA: hypothetical protein VL334_05600 [Anaerolineae bacterium]|nr:hypothetical protein [Anaerolineae bacterium]